MPVVATGVVVDAIAVANGEAVLGAIPPDRALHEPRKRCREGRIELASIDVRREQAENACAPSRLVALVSGWSARRPPSCIASKQINELGRRLLSRLLGQNRNGIAERLGDDAGLVVDRANSSSSKM
jgi:hypothetical protein